MFVLLHLNNQALNFLLFLGSLLNYCVASASFKVDHMFQLIKPLPKFCTKLRYITSRISKLVKFVEVWHVYSSEVCLHFGRMAWRLNWTTTTLGTFYKLWIWTSCRHLGNLRDLPGGCSHGSRLLFCYIGKGLFSHGLRRSDGTCVDITLLCKRSGRLMHCMIFRIDGSSSIELTNASIVLLDWKLVRWFSRKHFLWSLTRTRLVGTWKFRGCCLSKL